MSHPDPADLLPRLPLQEVLAAIVASSDDAIVSKDLNGVVTSWNPGAERTFGYTAAEMVGQSIIRLFPPDRLDEEPQILARLQRGERVDHFETIRLHKSGRPLHVSVTISPVKDAQGRVVGASKIARDVTAQKEAQAERERLLAAERQARAEADQARRSAEDHAAELQVANEELQSQQEELEQISEELRNANFDLHQQQAILAEHARALQEQQGRTAFLAEAGLILGATLDYETTLQSLAQLVVPKIADWCAIDMVDGEGELRRVAVAHADPMKVALVQQLHQQYPPRRDDRYGPPNVLRTGEPELYPEVGDAQLVALAHDPEHLRLLRQLGLVSGLAVPVTARGQVQGVLTLVTAQSGRRFGPGDLDFARELAQRAGLAADNARLYADLQEANRQKDRFLAMLAHELRNPLAAIANAAHVLEQVPLPPPGPRLTQVVTRQSAHLARMVDDLLDVSRITRGSVELQKELVELGPVVEAAVETTRSLVEARQHLLTLDLPAEPLRLLADATRVEQVVVNLLTNAVKYTEPGGKIEVTVEVERLEIGDRRLGRGGPAPDTTESPIGAPASVGHLQSPVAIIRVRDSGMGMPPELVPRVFDLFAQGDQSLARTAGGIGIGLTLVKNLVELHGGTVTARSEGPGKGSEFEVRLPALREARPRSLREAGGTAAGRRALRVLVVDDNPDSAETLADMLQLWGHEIQVVYHGQGALQAAAASPPDVVLCDLGLPGMDGYQVAAALRAEPVTRAVHLVAVTGYGGPEVARRCREAGFDCQLTKPVAPADLRSALADAAVGAGAGGGPPRGT